jgi:glutamate--cysteine ligase
MPAARRSITADDVRRCLSEQAFSTVSGSIGAEVEWIGFPTADPWAQVPFDTMRALIESAGPLRSRLTFEPGGQVELSGPAVPDLAAACSAIDADIAAIRRAVTPAGIALEGTGLDPLRPHRRVLRTPRYAAMERYFDSGGPAGRRMMCRTAAIQVNLDAGPDPDRRWRLAHAIGPVLASAFANSPFLEGKPMPWRSTRLATWWAMDRSRTSPVPDAGTAVEAWTRYVLEANVMLIRADADRYEAVMETLPFHRWIERGHPLGHPTMADLEYHLTTLFPPIRARGWLELRMIDAQSDPWWRAAIAVPAALLYDHEASGRAWKACERAVDRWLAAFSDGPSDAILAQAARECFAAAIDALPRLGADAATIDATREFAERFVQRHRCPADDLLDAWRARGVLPPFATMPAPARS